MHYLHFHTEYSKAEHFSAVLLFCEISTSDSLMIAKISSKIYTYFHICRLKKKKKNIQGKKKHTQKNVADLA